jgi:hypothetical protein
MKNDPRFSVKKLIVDPNGMITFMPPDEGVPTRLVLMLRSENGKSIIGPHIIEAKHVTSSAVPMSANLLKFKISSAVKDYVSATDINEGDLVVMSVGTVKGDECIAEELYEFRLTSRVARYAEKVLAAREFAAQLEARPAPSDNRQAPPQPPGNRADERAPGAGSPPAPTSASPAGTKKRSLIVWIFVAAIIAIIAGTWLYCSKSPSAWRYAGAPIANGNPFVHIGRPERDAAIAEPTNEDDANGGHIRQSISDIVTGSFSNCSNVDIHVDAKNYSVPPAEFNVTVQHIVTHHEPAEQSQTDASRLPPVPNQTPPLGQTDPSGAPLGYRYYNGEEQVMVFIGGIGGSYRWMPAYQFRSPDRRLRDYPFRNGERPQTHFPGDHLR